MRFALPIRAAGLAAQALLAAATASAQPPATGELRSVRAWSGPESTRIAVEFSRETKWKHGRLSNPERLYFDFPDTRPRLGPARIHVVPVGDARLRQARVALKDPRTTRLVLDLAADVDFEISHLTNPERLVVELRLKTAAPSGEDLSQAGTGKASPADAAAGPGARSAASSGGAETAPALRTSEAGASVAREAASPVRGSRPAAGESGRPAAADARSGSPAPPARTEIAAAPDTLRREAATPAPSAPVRAEAPSLDTRPRPEAPLARPETSSAPAMPPQPARPPRRGEPSLTRALGLHIGRVVLDPGHGGHDQGTQGPTGLLEKELVLDIALRLGALIEERLGGEVVYTRRTDEFISLEERTAIANESRADLFLSIHANSSPVRRVSGAEVFYLNFTTSREALELAARENAGHNRSIFELRELIQKIALKDKLDESREFAACMQQELAREWRRLNPAARDRGVKTAPFVVLIGASMPSVLAEIGFLSNPKDEALMKRPEYRQRLAEALYRGIERYARSLGQTQALRAANVPESPQSTR